jgi:hypothetical protein
VTDYTGIEAALGRFSLLFCGIAADPKISEQSLREINE